MIQLTKGTNVLDINLSDFSGAGQDVVQNGSFTDIGSDLILNGDFAEIGSDLVTNGDFSAVPLGSELVTYPNFTNSDLVQWKIASSRATKSWDAAEFMRLTYDVAVGSALYATFGQTLNAYYNVKMRVRGTKADGVTAQGYAFGSIGDNGELGQVVSNPTLTSEWQDYEFNVWSTGTTFRFYLTTVAVGDLVDFDSISVKENINLVSNPNFTDTGIELVDNNDFSNGTTDWTAENTATISIGTHEGRPDVADININNALNSERITQPFTFVNGASYKVTVEVYLVSGSFRVDSSNLYVVGDFVSTTTTGSWQTLTGYITAIQSGVSSIFLRSITEVSQFYVDNVSVKELGADWNSVDGDIDTYNENGVTITSINTDSYNRLYQGLVTEDGKSYKVTYTIHATSYSTGTVAQYYDGDTYNALPEQGVGTHTFYFTRDAANDSWYFNLNASASASTTDYVTISNLSVQELGEGWTLGTGWSVGEDKAVYDGTGGTSRIFQNITVSADKYYKISLTVLSNEGTGTNPIYFGSVLLGSTHLEASATPYVFYGLSDATTETLSIYGRASEVFEVTNITVQEVGQDWTVTNSDSTHYVEFFGGVGGARYYSLDAGVSALSLNQVAIPVIGYGKSYKLTCDCTFTSGTNIRFYSGTLNVGLLTEGANTLYFVADNNQTIAFIRNLDALVDVEINNVIVQQLDTNDRWVTFADPDSKSVMKLGQVDLEIDTLGHDCGVYQTGLIKPNKLYIITINMKATAAINVEIAASLGTAVSAVIGTTLLTTSYVEYSFEYVTPFAVDHDLQIHRLFGTGADQTISIDYVSMNGVDESKWINDPTWNPFATSLVFVPTLTDESTNNSKQFTLFTAIAGGGWNGRSLHGQVIINNFPAEAPAVGIINLQQPDFLEGFYQVEIRGYLGTFYRILGKGMAHLERASTEDGYNRFEAYNDSVTYKAYEE